MEKSNKYWFWHRLGHHLLFPITWNRMLFDDLRMRYHLIPASKEQKKAENMLAK